MITRTITKFSKLHFEATNTHSTIYTDTQFKNETHATKLILEEVKDNKFIGSITSDIINCRFIWNKSVFSQPWVGPQYYNSQPFSVENRQVAQAFVVATIGSIACDAIGEYHPVAGRVPTEPYISQLIKKGHLRRPHLAKLKNHVDLIIRKGTVTNPAKIDKPLESVLQFLAKLLNEAVAANTDKFMMSFELWRQLWHGQWIANRNGIEEEHEAYRKYCHDKLRDFLNEKTKEISATKLSKEQIEILKNATKVETE